MGLLSNTCEALYWFGLGLGLQSDIRAHKLKGGCPQKLMVKYSPILQKFLMQILTMPG